MTIFKARGFISMAHRRLLNVSVQQFGSALATQTRTGPVLSSRNLKKKKTLHGISKVVLD